MTTSNTKQQQIPGEVILSSDVTCAKIGVPKPTRDRWIREGKFPPPVRLGPRRVGWKLSEVEAWIAARVARNVQAVAA